MELRTGGRRHENWRIAEKGRSGEGEKAAEEKGQEKSRGGGQILGLK